MTTYRTVTYSTYHAQPHDYQLTNSNHADYSGPQELLWVNHTMLDLRYCNITPLGVCITGPLLLYNSPVVQ